MRYTPARIVSSVQHIEAAPTVVLERAVRELFTRVLREEAARMPELLAFICYGHAADPHRG